MQQYKEEIIQAQCDLLINERNHKCNLSMFADKIIFNISIGLLWMKSSKQENTITLDLSRIDKIELRLNTIVINPGHIDQIKLSNFQSSEHDLFDKINDRLIQIRRDNISGSFGELSFSNSPNLSTIKSFVSKFGQESNWNHFRNQQEKLLSKIIQLKSNHEYGEPCSLILNDVSISDVFDIIFTDQPYQPSTFMKLGAKQQFSYQNPMHYLCEEMVGDRLMKSTLWWPNITQYIKQSEFEQINVPNSYLNITDLPERTLTMEHPVLIPLLGTIYAKITMTQKFIPLDQKEFWICTSTVINDMLYAENFKLKGYYQIKEINYRQFEVVTRQCVEWNRKLFLITKQIDAGAAHEYKRMCEFKVVPFLKERNTEIIMIRNQIDKMDQLEKSLNSSIALPELYPKVLNPRPQQQKHLSFQQDYRQQQISLIEKLQSIKTIVNEQSIKMNQLISISSILVLIQIIILSFILQRRLL